MNLAAEVATAYLDGMPGRVAQRMLLDEGLSSLLTVGVGEVAGVGAFRYADVRATLATAPLNVPVPLQASKSDHQIHLTRRSDGHHIARGHAGVEASIPELGLLDPDSEIRRRAVDAIADRVRPWWPRASYWVETSLSRPLSEVEFVRLLDDIRSSGEYRLASISDASRKDQIGVSDIVPTTLDYFLSLVGPAPIATGASDYVKSTLIPHLESVLARDPNWGLRCIQAACIGSEVDPDLVGRSLPTGLLLAALQEVGHGYTASSALCTFRLARSRAGEQPELSVIAGKALDFLLESCESGESKLGTADLHLSLAKLTLRVISQSEQISGLPPYWRRLASFVHASFLLDAIDFTRSDVQSLVSWCDSQRISDMTSAQLLDRTVEPLWHADAQGTAQAWASAVARAVGWNPRTGSIDIEISPEQRQKLDRLMPKLVFFAASPDPLSGSLRRNRVSGTPEIGLDLLESINREAHPEESLENHRDRRTWEALAYTSTIYRFSDSLLVRVRNEASGLSLVHEGSRDEVYLMLENAAAIAACQPDRELAEIVANAVLVSADSVRDADEALKSAAILVITSGFEPDEEPRLKWTAQRLTSLAFQVRTGGAKLAAFIVSLQRFSRLANRQWGRAVAAARAVLD